MSTRQYFQILFLLSIFSHIMVCQGYQQNQDKSTATELRAVEFVTMISSEDFAEASRLFDQILQVALPPEKIREHWDNLIDLVGPYQGILRQNLVVKQTYYIVTISCAFEKQRVKIQIVMDRANRITGFWFLPDKDNETGLYQYQTPSYVEKEQFHEQEVAIGENQWIVPGTLTLPKEPNSCPAIVLIHDVGPHDRDETIGPNKPFRDLAWGLASRGIAVLRFDKRTKVYQDNTELVNNLTVQSEIIEDVLAAITLLGQHDQIDPSNIYLIGHGLGGMLVPQIVKQNPDIAGSIVISGMIRNLEDVHFREKNYEFSFDGIISKSEKEELDKIRSQIALVKNERLADMRNISELPMGLPREYWLDIRQYNPGIVAQELSSPMLILQGGRDYQVTLDDYRGWQNFLQDRVNVQYKLYLKLNHLFMLGNGTGKSSPMEYQKPDHVDLKVIEDISQWIKGR